MVTQSIKAALTGNPRRGLLQATALAVVVLAQGCDSGDSNSAMPGGTASVKFCNTFFMGSAAAPVPFDMILQIGNPGVKLVAKSGECSSAVAAACTTVPSGVNGYRLIADNQVLDWGTLSFYSGEQFVVFTSPDSRMAPRAVDVLLDMPDKCDSFDFFKVVSGGGAPMMMPNPMPRP